MKDVEIIADIFYECFSIYHNNFSFGNLDYINKKSSETGIYKLELGNYYQQTFHHYRDNCWKKFVDIMKDKFDCEIKELPKCRNFYYHYTKTQVLTISGKYKISFYQEQGCTKCQDDSTNSNIIELNSKELFDLMYEKIKHYDETVLKQDRIKSCENDIKYYTSLIEWRKKELKKLRENE